MSHQSEKDPETPVAATRADVIEILAGAVLALHLQGGRRPSPDEAPRSQKALNSAISGPFRAPE